MPAKTNDNATAGPAWTPAALPVSTKMPVPMTTPTPKTVRSIAPSRLRSWCVGSSVSAMDCSMVFVRHRFMPTSSTSGHGGAGSDAAAPAMKCPMVGAPRNPLYPVAGLLRSPRLRTRQLRLVGLDSLRRQLLENAPTTTVDSPRSARTRQRKGQVHRRTQEVEERSRWRWSLRVSAYIGIRTSLSLLRGPTERTGTFPVQALTTTARTLQVRYQLFGTH